MQGYLKRRLNKRILQDLNFFPVVCLIGPRQCGKSTLAQELLKECGKEFIFLDLERDSDLAKLVHSEDYLNLYIDTLVCIDEVQRKPDLFPLLRYLVDANRKPGRFFLLGSASSKLVNQSSESLAGRISYQELTPFLLVEILEENDVHQNQDQNQKTKTLWERGGFPDSFLAPSSALSFRWREEFFKTLIERDIPLLDIRIPALTLNRMLSMLAHSHGQVVNLSKLGDSLGLSHTTIRQYIDLFENIFMVRTLPPFEVNLKKRLVKSPKIYIRDSGVLHALLRLDSLAEILAHPVCGASWEGFVIEQITSCLNSRWAYGFYRTQTGTEIDLVLEKNGVTIGVECKLSAAPTLTKGFWQACRDLNIKKAYIVAPVAEAFPYGAQEDCTCTVMPLSVFLNEVLGVEGSF